MLTNLLKIVAFVRTILPIDTMDAVAEHLIDYFKRWHFSETSFRLQIFLQILNIFLFMWPSYFSIKYVKHFSRTFKLHFTRETHIWNNQQPTFWLPYLHINSPLYFSYLFLWFLSLCLSCLLRKAIHYSMSIFSLWKKQIWEKWRRE